MSKKKKNLYSIKQNAIYHYSPQVDNRKYAYPIPSLLLHSE